MVSIKRDLNNKKKTKEKNIGEIKRWIVDSTSSLPSFNRIKSAVLKGIRARRDGMVKEVGVQEEPNKAN